MAIFVLRKCRNSYLSFRIFLISHCVLLKCLSPRIWCGWFLFFNYHLVWSFGRDYVICSYFKIPDNFVRLILQDRFWFVHILLLALLQVGSMSRDKGLTQKLIINSWKAQLIAKRVWHNFWKKHQLSSEFSNDLAPLLQEYTWLKKKRESINISKDSSRKHLRKSSRAKLTRWRRRKSKEQKSTFITHMWKPLPTPLGAS